MQRVLNDSRPARLTVAVLAALLALMLWGLLQYLAGPAALWLCFSGGVVLGAWFGGLKPGLITTFILTVAAVYINETNAPAEQTASAARWASGMFALMAFAVCFAMQGLRMERFKAQHAQERLHQVLESTQDLVISVDQDFRCLFANARAGQFAKKAPPQLFGRSLRTIFPEAPGTVVYRELNHVLRDRLPAKFQDRMEGTRRWYEFEAYPMPTGITLFIRDITPQKNAEAERAAKARVRQKAYSQLESVAREIPVGVIVVTSELRVELANSAACDIFQQTMEPGAFFSARQAGKMRLPGGEELPPDRWPLRHTILAGAPILNMEVEYEREDGVQLNLIVNSLPLSNSDGSIRGALATYSNITSIREMQRALGANEAAS